MVSCRSLVKDDGCISIQLFPAKCSMTSSWVQEGVGPVSSVHGSSDQGRCGSIDKSGWQRE